MTPWPQASPILACQTLDRLYIDQVFAYYQQCLWANPALLAQVQAEQQLTAQALKAAQIGYCNRTLGLLLPDSRTKEGGAIRGALQRLGLLRNTGHELFRGCLVFPEQEDGGIWAAKGRRLAPYLKPHQSRWLYWQYPDDHQT